MTIEHARQARAARTRAMARLRTGALSVRDVLLEPPRGLQDVDLYPVLMACPRMGKQRVRILCERSHVWPHLTLGELSKSQRRALVENLP